MRGTWIIVAAVCSLLSLSACGSEAAPPAASGPPSVSGVDYSKNRKANERASNAADPYYTALQKDPTFGGLAIVASGLRVDVVGEPSTTVNDAVTGMRKTVPVTVRTVRNSLNDLMALTDQITRESEQWRAKGITLSNWGPAENTNTVHLFLTHYTPEAAKQLIDAYGSDRLSVPKRSEAMPELRNEPASGAPSS